MISKRIILFVLLSCFLSVSFSQENAISNAIKKNKITFSDTKSESAVADLLNNNLDTIESKNQKHILELFLNNLSIGVSYGISEFQGDIKEDGFINTNNTNNLYNFRISKQINKVFSISSEILFGDLNGSKKSESYLISEDKSVVVYDPYDLYEDLGEEFSADFLEFDLITSINLESLIKYYYPEYSDKNQFDFYYNIGFGITSFKSIKRNSESGTYIYGYGYKDLEGEYESPKDFSDQPKAGVVCYGYSASYLANPTMKWKVIFLTRLVDTDFLDASLMSDNYDKFRNISLGLDYTF